MMKVREGEKETERERQDYNTTNTFEKFYKNQNH